ncbi:MAG: hypothetical protein ABI652_08185 [Acidobacteriota bacterium]
MFMFRSLRHLTALLVATGVTMCAWPASAQIVNSIQFGAGGLVPRGFDSRAQGDVLVADLTNDTPLLFFVNDFRSGQVFGEWNVGLGQHVEIGAGVGFFQRTVPSIYADLVNKKNGSEIDQRLRLRMVPITGLVRFLPFGRAGEVQPYVGAGIAAVSFRYSESGQFVDTSDFSVFDARFTASGVAPGAVLLGGVRLPLGGDIYGLSLEGRYQFATGNTGGADAGFLDDKIDLSGGSFNVGFLVRF